MGNFITIGEYNKLYKFMWFFISFKLIYEYLYGSDFPIEIKLIKHYSFPKSVLIQEFLNYIGVFIFSIFLFIYEKIQNKPETSEEESHNSHNTNDSHSTSRKSIKSPLIYQNYENYTVSYKPVIIVIILIIVCDQLRNTFFIFNLKGLDFKMFEILFVCIITFLMFKITIYRHKKIAIGFLVIFCLAMKTLSVIYRIIDDHKKRIFKIYTWIIPIGISGFILISLLRSYNFCKVKWLFDLRFISVSKLLLFYGSLGFIFCFIISTVVNYVPCVDKDTFSNINFICNVTEVDSSTNSTIYYYERYSVYIKSLWKKERHSYINVLFLVLIVIKTFLYFLIKLFGLLIIKNLRPEYLICSNAIYYFIIESIDTIECLILGKFRYYKLYDILEDLFSILGTVFYLELIEFDFCGIDFNLKKNIKKRCLSESKLGSSLEESSEDSNVSD